MGVSYDVAERMSNIVERGDTILSAAQALSQSSGKNSPRGIATSMVDSTPWQNLLDQGGVRLLECFFFAQCLPAFSGLRFTRPQRPAGSTRVRAALTDYLGLHRAFKKLKSRIYIARTRSRDPLDEARLSFLFGTHDRLFSRLMHHL